MIKHSYLNHVASSPDGVAFNAKLVPGARENHEETIDAMYFYMKG